MKNVNVERLIQNFKISGTIIDISEMSDGHINSTFIVTCKDGDTVNKYTLQKINAHVFKNPKQVMENICSITDHIKKKLLELGEDPERRTLHVRKTVNNSKIYVDNVGNHWRVYAFIDNSIAYQTLESSELFEKVGFAFGDFQKKLSDFDASKLYETIPNFHNTESRYKDFITAVEEDPCGRVESCRDEINFVLSCKKDCSFIMDGIRNGIFPLRVTHNDTKLNNILMDRSTNEPICVIDLDTVMPGSALADFGDAIRYGASSAAEDETDLSKVYVREEYFDAFSRGFLRALHGSLTQAEILALPMGAYILTLETGIRFLTDHINGDVYFKIHRENHNLDRARNQFKLASDIKARLGELNSIIIKYAH